MRFRGAAFALIVFAVVSTICLGIAGAQTPASTKQTAAPKTATAPARPVQANLAQLMRGILLPASNVIFFAQGNNPADVKQAADPSSATDPLASTYGGWTAVENSALALTEAARLLAVPGRCQRPPVPDMRIGRSSFKASARRGPMPIRPLKRKTKTRCSTPLEPSVPPVRIVTTSIVRRQTRKAASPAAARSEFFVLSQFETLRFSIFPH